MTQTETSTGCAAWAKLALVALLGGAAVALPLALSGCGTTPASERYWRAERQHLRRASTEEDLPPVAREIARDAHDVLADVLHHELGDPLPADVAERTEAARRAYVAEDGEGAGE